MVEAQDSQGTKQGVFARHPWLHFFWVTPFTGTAGAYCLLMASLNVCGISGCSGGGFGVSRGDPKLTATYVVIGSLLWTLPIGAVPWTKKVAVRLVVMTVLAVMIGVAVWNLISE